MKSQLLNLTLAIMLLITSFSCQENEVSAIEQNRENFDQLILLNNETLINTPLDGDEIINFQIEDTLFQFDNLVDLENWNEIGSAKLGFDQKIDFAKQVNDINKLYEYATHNNLLDSENVPDEALRILGLTNTSSSQRLPAYATLYDGIGRSGQEWQMFFGVGLKPSFGSARNKVESFYAFGAWTGWMCDKRWGGGTKWYWAMYPEQYQYSIGTQANRWESSIGLF